jgi:hypothetical protein
MKKLLQIERIKAFEYPAFKALMLIHFVLFLLVFLVVSRIRFSVPNFAISDLYAFPLVWYYVPWVASFFNIFLAIVVILITGNEYSHGTFHQSVMNGLSRDDLWISKFGLIVQVALYTLVLTLATSLISGIFATESVDAAMIFSHVEVVFLYFLQALAYMTLGLLFVVLLKSNALSIILFILYIFPIEPILRTVFPEAVRNFFPAKAIGLLTKGPGHWGLFPQAQDYVANANGSIQLQTLPSTDSLPSDWILAGVVAGYTLLFLVLIKVRLQRVNLK